ncbi:MULTISPECIES: MFS transporter [Protofrankia]|uniref:Major facilitator superfamily MFS_1 n=1 Tax=Candidatus Protofrankia datiscae TaxID=2716812 RepID=F8AXT1_9ACTN|nr:MULTISPECIES: MFS transporter [Protofrankia]AEH11499.1 major facilitator superfamily MFS_1 [Candidatus Protofrankia datiscae]
MSDIIVPAPITLSRSRRRWLALLVALTAQLMIILDSSVVNVALPVIQNDLHFSQANLTWVVNAYMISYGSFLLVAGRLGDLVGRKKVFLAGMALFTAASAACGLSDGQAFLIAARFAQGLGGALASATILAFIVTDFPQPQERARAMSVYLLVTVSGGSLGLLLGGALTQALGWHWIFVINIPIGLLALPAAAAFLSERPGSGLRQGADLPGAVLVTAAALIGIDAIVQAAEYGWLSGHTLGLGAVTVALLGAFAVRESRTSNPLVPIRILRLRSLIGSSAVRAVVAAGMYGVFFFGALYLEQTLGYDAVHTGLAFLPQTVMVAVLSMGITARLVSAWGPERVLVAGLISMIVGLLLLAWSLGGEHVDYFPGLFFAFVLVGLGTGAVFMPLLTMAVAQVAPADAGLASGIVNVSMQISAAVGLAALGTLSSNRTAGLLADGHSQLAAFTGGCRLGVLTGAGCVAFGLLLAVTVLRAPRSRREVVDVPSQPADGAVLPGQSARSR